MGVKTTLCKFYVRKKCAIFVCKKIFRNCKIQDTPLTEMNYLKCLKEVQKTILPLLEEYP